MFSKRRTSPHVYNSIEKGNLDPFFSSYYVPTPVDEFLTETVQNEDGSESVTLTTDIAMLFNQQRLDKCSRESLLQYFDSLSVSPSTGLSELRSKLSDDQLISIIKSRYIQTPSELLSYSRALVSEYGSEIAQLVSSDPDSNNTVPPSHAGEGSQDS